MRNVVCSKGRLLIFVRKKYIEKDVFEVEKLMISSDVIVYIYG